MKFFFVLETIPLMIDTLNYIYHEGVRTRLIECYPVWLDIVQHEYTWIIYPLIQAFGMIFLKDSKDPLQGISDLNLIMIVSSN